MGYGRGRGYGGGMGSGMRGGRSGGMSGQHIVHMRGLPFRVSEQDIMEVRAYLDLLKVTYEKGVI